MDGKTEKEQHANAVMPGQFDSSHIQMDKALSTDKNDYLSVGSLTLHWESITVLHSQETSLLEWGHQRETTPFVFKALENTKLESLHTMKWSPFLAEPVVLFL